MRHGIWKKQILCLLLAAVCLCALPLCALAEDADDEGDITALCTFLSANKRAALESLTDDSAKTKLSLAANEWFSLQWKGTEQAQGLYLRWESVPETYIVEQRDRAGSTLWTGVISGGMPQQYITLDERCGVVLVLSSSGKGVLSDACLCRADTPLPDRVHAWSEPESKADLMLFAAAPGDETSIFTGLLETYSLEKGLSCVLVYLGGAETDAKKNAALDALWDAGFTVLPVFGTYKTKAVRAGSDAEDSSLSFAVEQVRRFKPAVLVSHAADGEGGDALRTEAYRAVRQAGSLAEDVSVYPSSAAKYGTWRPLKLYLHEHETRRITLAGVTYGLVFSSVGDDTAGDDLFENIPETEYAGYVPPEETPAPTSTPTPFAPTPTPAAPAATAEPELESVRRATDYATIALFGLFGIILVLVIILAVRVIREWRKNGVPPLKKRAKQPDDAPAPDGTKPGGAEPRKTKPDETKPGQDGKEA